MEVVFLKPEVGRRYRSRLTRPGGLVVELEGGSWNRIGGAERELPHDLAHLVVEDGLELTRGLWAAIAAGAVFGQVQVVEGRRPPHHDARGRALFAAWKTPIGEAEMLVKMVCDVAVAGDAGDPRASGPWRGPERIPAAAIAATVDRLREAARAWAATPRGTELRWEAPNLGPSTPPRATASIRTGARRRR